VLSVIPLSPLPQVLFVFPFFPPLSTSAPVPSIGLPVLFPTNFFFFRSAMPALGPLEERMDLFWRKPSIPPLNRGTEAARRWCLFKRMDDCYSFAKEAFLFPPSALAKAPRFSQTNARLPFFFFFRKNLPSFFLPRPP